MMRSLCWSLVALSAASVCYGQGPVRAYPLNPPPAKFVSAEANPIAPAGYGAPVGSGCATCGGGQGYTGYGPGDFGLGQAGTGYNAYGIVGNGGCAGGDCGNCNTRCQVGSPGFVGGCCDYLKPRARGLWNSYCGDRHHGHGGGCGCGGSPTPIGLYGATPFGCCAAGVNCGHGCGLFSSCNSPCGTPGCNNCFGWFSSRGGCGCGVTKPCGWRMGLGGYPCSADTSCGAEPGCGCAAGGSSNGHPTAAQPTVPADEPAPQPPVVEEEPAPALPNKGAVKSKSPGWMSSLKKPGAR